MISLKDVKIQIENDYYDVECTKPCKIIIMTHIETGKYVLCEYNSNIQFIKGYLLGKLEKIIENEI